MWNNLERSSAATFGSLEIIVDDGQMERILENPDCYWMSMFMLKKCKKYDGIWASEGL